MAQAKNAPVNPANVAKARAEWDDRKDDQAVQRESRIEAAASRTPAQQLRRLNERLGAGVGAKRERAKLALAS